MTKFASTYRVVLCPQQAGGNRVAKHTYTAVGAYKSSTFYVRDAGGNVMLGSSWPKWNVGLEMPIPWRSITGATYQTVVDALTQTETFKLIERPIYGSSRVGLDVTKVEWIVTTGTTGEQIIEVEPASVPKSYTRELGHKQYELSNHLGNVLVVVNDIKRAVINNNSIEYYTAQVVSATDYSPFGVILEGRTYSSGEYRYGFQAQEQDSELWEGAVTYKYRVEDPRLGRFFSVDPLFAKYAFNSVYAFSENRLIDGFELEGLETVLTGATAGNSAEGGATASAGAMTTGVGGAAQGSLGTASQSRGSAALFGGISCSFNLSMNGQSNLAFASAGTAGFAANYKTEGSGTFGIQWETSFQNYGGQFSGMSNQTRTAGLTWTPTGSDTEFFLLWTNDNDLLNIKNHLPGKSSDFGLTDGQTLGLRTANNAFYFQTKMFTPSGELGPDGKLANVSNEGSGLMATNGFYESDNIEGAFRYFMTLNYCGKTKFGSVTLSAGINSPKIGAVVQGQIHKGVDAPEFKWQGASDYNRMTPVVGVNLQINLFRTQ